jgi:hypothetical protein
MIVSRSCLALPMTFTVPAASALFIADLCINAFGEAEQSIVRVVLGWAQRPHPFLAGVGDRVGEDPDPHARGD